MCTPQEYQYKFKYYLKIEIGCGVSLIVVAVPDDDPHRTAGILNCATASDTGGRVGLVANDPLAIAGRMNQEFRRYKLQNTAAIAAGPLDFKLIILS